MPKNEYSVELLKLIDLSMGMVFICLLLTCGCIFESKEEVEEFTAWRCGINPKVV